MANMCTCAHWNEGQVPMLELSDSCDQSIIVIVNCNHDSDSEHYNMIVRN